MLKYIIRLDDACQNMNEENWIKMEELLDKYNIKPIVGVIPDNKDPDFNYKTISNFWEKYPCKWQKKGWIIAQHGFNHTLNGVLMSEFVNKNYIEQKKIIENGYQLLVKKGIKPTCFFAPAHSFNDDTIRACKDLNFFDFISDGYAFYPYNKNEMLFIPSVFDTPHKISCFGIFTFVYHPNNLTSDSLKYLEDFLIKNIDKFDVNYDDIMLKFKNRKRNVADYFLNFAIISYRKIRGKNYE